MGTTVKANPPTMLEEANLRESTRARGLAALLFVLVACDRGETPLVPSAGESSSVPSASTAPSAGRLVSASGAFLRSHSDDPVEWRPWSSAVLDEAAATGRPVMVISGSWTCTGCEVLLGRLAADAELVDTINRRFVPVLLDRDERPDIDESLMQAVVLVTGSAGWPLVVFLERDGRPFDAYSWGVAGGGDKPLARIVDTVVRKLELGGGTTAERAELLGEKLAARAALDPSGELPDSAAVFAALRGYLAASWDPRAAAFGAPPLFPRAPVLDFLLHLNGRTGDGGALEMVVAALRRLRESPLRDAGDGGFFRYAREAGWKSPASDKALADNAALASVLLDAARAGDRPELRETAHGIVDFLLTRMRLSGGAFAAALAAEGRRDERVLADANAVAISALVHASAALAEERYREAALAAAEVLDTRLRRGGLVLHCLEEDGRTCGDGYLDDQVLVALAFLDLDESAGSGGDARWLAAAREIADALPGRFGHTGTGGFFTSSPEAEPRLLRYKPALDGAHACGNSAAAALYVRLAKRTGEARYAELATQTLEAFAEVLTLKPLAVPSMAVALDRLEHRPATKPVP